MYSQIYLDYVQDIKKRFFPSSCGHDCKKKNDVVVCACVDCLKKIVDRLCILLNILKRLAMSVTFFTFVTRVYGLCLRVWMSRVKHPPEDHLSSISTPAVTGMIFVTVVCPVS